MGSGLKYVKVDAAGTIRSEFVEAAPREEENMIISDTMNLSSLAPLAPPEQVYEVEANVMAGIQLIVPDRLLKIMITDIESMSFDASPVVYLTDLDYYRRSLANLLPPGKETDAALASLGTGLMEVPEKVNPYTFLSLPLFPNPRF